MEITFSNIQWRNNDDASVFNLHALHSINLEGFDSFGICTIKCACGEFKSPYCKLSLGGGVTHFSFIVMHPYELNSYLEIAIFENKVCVVNADLPEKCYSPKFINACKNFCV